MAFPHFLSIYSLKCNMSSPEGSWICFPSAGMMFLLSPLSELKPNISSSVLSFGGCILVRFSGETEPRGYVHNESDLL